MLEAPKPARDYLVFVRAGGNSLHPRWLAEDPTRNWDCCVSWYCEPREAAPAEFSSHGGDNKFEGFECFAAGFPGLNRYRYVLLVDDDVAFRAGDVSRFLALCDRFGIDLAQPSLRWRTHYNHAVTLHNPACLLRRVSFIEVMAPCFSAASLANLRDSFTMGKSSWGIDWVWAARAAREGFSLDIVDAVQVEHTKPFDPKGGAFYRKLRAMGVDPVAEETRALALFPDFVPRKRSLHDGHVYSHGLPPAIGRPLLALFERLKLAARVLKKWRRLSAGSR